MKVKNGMSGKGNGRWTTRTVAKKSCKKLRRQYDKKLTQIKG
jgi:hypothetical protein